MVLVVEVRKTGVLGLVLNRPLPNVPISRVFAGAKKVSDPVYYGGPVERGGMVGLSRFLRPAFKALVADVATHLHAVKS